MVGGLKLPEHSHCKFCGDPVPFGQDYCDEECRAGHIARERAEKRKEYMFWGSAGVIIVVVIAIGVAVRLL